MVRVLLFLIFTLQVYGLETLSISASIDQDTAYANQPIPVSIAVTHDKNEKIDVSSFKADKKPITVTFVKDVSFETNSPFIMSMYSYQMPAMSKGLQVLPSFSVTVGGKEIHSVLTGFEVQEAQAPDPSQGIVLKLEPFIDGPLPLYPGERVMVGYKYLFNGNIDLTKEEIPLIKAEGLKIVGEKELNDIHENGYDGVIVSQIVEGQEPGMFRYGPSIIQGYTYQVDRSGKKQYIEPIITAQAPVVEIEVKPFPATGKPASFEGAVGNFSFDVKMLTPATVNVDDRVTLVLSVKGNGQLQNVTIPSLCCQPGFSGLFKSGDFPPVGKIEGETKNFLVDLRPISSVIQQIPPIEFSFFNPEKQTYEKLFSKAIPLQVKAPQEVAVVEKKQLKNEEPNYAPRTLNLESVYAITNASLGNKLFGNWWVFMLIPLGGVVILAQIQMKKRLESIVEEIETPEEIYAKAKQSQSLTQLRRALEKSPKPEAKELLQEVDKQLFSPNKSSEDLFEKSKKVFES